LIVFIVAPLHNDTDFDLGRIRLDEPAAPIKNQSNRIGCEHHTFVERDVFRFHDSIAVEVHFHAVSVVVKHFESSHLIGIRSVPAHGVDARLFGVAGDQARGVSQADALSGGRDAEDGQRALESAGAGADGGEGERADELAEEQGAGPQADTAAPLVEGQPVDRPGEQGGQQQTTAHAREHQSELEERTGEPGDAAARGDDHETDRDQPHGHGQQGVRAGMGHLHEDDGTDRGGQQDQRTHQANRARPGAELVQQVADLHDGRIEDDGADDREEPARQQPPPG